MAERPLRLLALAPAASIHTIRWLRTLEERGHELHLVTSTPPRPQDDVGGTTVYDLRELEGAMRLPGLRRYRVALAIRRLAERIEPDVVHAHGMLPNAWWAARADVHPLVVSPWGRDVLVDAQREPGRSRARLGFERADYVVVNSQAILDASVGLGADVGRTLHTLWHVRLDGFSPDRADRAGLRRQLGWPEDALVVLSLRNFQPGMNLDVLVRAFARVRREVPAARLVLSARGGSIRGEIEALVAELGLGDVVRFHRAATSDVPALVASADVTVTISDTDSTSSALLEAMASGQPLIGGRCASIDEWIGPGEGAEMIDPTDEDALVAALLKLLGDPELRLRYGARNVEVARRDVAASGSALEALYRELAEGRVPVPALAG
jgi:glycosyltransferase involved in cell wall biosynthesis